MNVFKHLHSPVHQRAAKADSLPLVAMLAFKFLEPHDFGLQQCRYLLGQNSRARQAHDVTGFPA